MCNIIESGLLSDWAYGMHRVWHGTDGEADPKAGAGRSVGLAAGPVRQAGPPAGRLVEHSRDNNKSDYIK